MKSDFGIALVGVGGYGRNHIESIRRCNEAGQGTLLGVTIRPEDAEPEFEAELASDGIEVYRDFDQMLEAEKRRASLIAIPTGIPSHRILSVKALVSGFHVICEKPAAGSVEDADAMRMAKDRSGKLLAIGYQYLYASNVRKIKEIAISGSLGRLESCRGLALWPRGEVYYSRNDWAGRIESNGYLVRDSPAQNAVSHFLNTMLFLAGPTFLESSTLSSVYGENYRAKPIESADTQYIRVSTTNGTTIEFWCSHAVEHLRDIELALEFEGGSINVVYSDTGASYSFTPAKGVDSSTIVFNEDDEADIRYQVFAESIDSAKRGRTPVSSIENALVHTQLIETLFTRCSPVRSVPGEYLKTITDTQESEAGGGGTQVIRDLETVSVECFEKGVGYNEAGVGWGAAGDEVSL